MNLTELSTIATACTLLIASCYYQLYPVKTLTDNYEMRMITTEDLTAKSNVKIFIDEKEIKGDYEVIAFLTYSPPVFPIFMSAKKR